MSIRRFENLQECHIVFFFDDEKSGVVRFDILSGVRLLNLPPIDAFDLETVRIIEVAREKLRRGETDKQYEGGTLVRLTMDDLPLNYDLLKR